MAQEIKNMTWISKGGEEKEHSFENQIVVEWKTCYQQSLLYPVEREEVWRINVTLWTDQTAFKGRSA